MPALGNVDVCLAGVAELIYSLGQFTQVVEGGLIFAIEGVSHEGDVVSLADAGIGDEGFYVGDVVSIEGDDVQVLEIAERTYVDDLVAHFG